MIITVTLNPSIDRTFDTERLELGEVNRALRTHLDAGGKGINVSRGLHQNGVATVAVFPVGGPDGPLLVAELEAVGVAVHPVRIKGAIRSNVTVADADGETTKINAPGPRVDEAEQVAILHAVHEHLDRGTTCVIAAGSLPEGIAPSFLTRLAELAAAQHVPFALDTSGAPLAAAVRAGGLAVVKPNDLELAELVGRELLTVGEVRDAAREIIAMGTVAVLVSLGAHGALLVTADGSWWAGGDPIVPVSTVGAGDSTLAGYLSAAGKPEPERLRTAVAWGRAAVQLPGTEVPRPEQIDPAAVRVVEEPAPGLTLKEL
ncbi:1-phosphofructokinase [Actinotalea sp.]|uniref:1-phosphofructokinase n=1 Tax=Actinotalea sp. TaxID=1872145 RepID=UPI002BCEA539|nr:1-phosphofructokinase [Actinotalea sp.]HQY33758.1 1-phosphofructokinase [Actinotalea sp.]HRA51784.1 1-phosphofructokinase [Actinotalea sp.]